MMDQKLTRNERDMLIMLNTKVDQLGLDIKDIKDNTMIRITKLESWKDTVDIYHARIDLDRFTKLADWVQKVKNNWVFVAGFLFLLGGIAGAIFQVLLHLWFPMIK